MTDRIDPYTALIIQPEVTVIKDRKTFRKISIVLIT